MLSLPTSINRRRTRQYSKQAPHSKARSLTLMNCNTEHHIPTEQCSREIIRIPGTALTTNPRRVISKGRKEDDSFFDPTPMSTMKCCSVVFSLNAQLTVSNSSLSVRFYLEIPSVFRNSIRRPTDTEDMKQL